VKLLVEQDARKMKELSDMENILNPDRESIANPFMGEQ